MEGLFGAVGFGIGVSLGMGVARAAGKFAAPLLGGLSPRPAAVVPTTLAKTGDRSSSNDPTSPSDRPPAARPGSKRRAKADSPTPQRIVIAHE